MPSAIVFLRPLGLRLVVYMDGVGFGGAGGGFALLVVLFILLIIIGASFVGGFV